MNKSIAHLPQTKADDAYIGARYDPEYKITKQQLGQLAPCVKRLHEVIEKVCKEKIDSVVDD